MPTRAPTLAEIQGLYGAFAFPEKLLQKIWLRGDFDRSALLLPDGTRVRVLYPGKWNLLGGPDFRDARLAFGDEREVTGDIEIHLRAADWDAHAHARDPAYNGVILHVVLFPPEPGKVTRGAGGVEIPVVALLPLLHHDLEEFAAEDVVEVLASRPAMRMTEELAALPPGELLVTLRRHAGIRWRQKVHFAGLRVARLGWDAACHHAALEILGYRFNRAAMLRVAGQWPLRAWTRGEVSADDAFQAEAGTWSLQGVRPANQPRTRLRQYAAWIEARPDWPQRLGALSGRLPVVAADAETRRTRRLQMLMPLRGMVADEICADQLGGTRFDNLVCDGLWPLLASQTRSDLEGLWSQWFMGDVPGFVATGLRQLGVFDGRRQPACHGLAQGLLGWLIAREAQRT